MSSKRNDHGTFCGWTRTTSIRIVRLTHTVVVFGHKKPTVVPANYVTLFAGNGMVRLYCNIHSGPIFFRRAQRRMSCDMLCSFTANDTHRYGSTPWFRLCRHSNVFQQKCLCRMVLLYPQPILWNRCCVAILLKTQSSAIIFPWLGLTDPQNLILAFLGCGAILKNWFIGILSHHSPALKK